MKLSRIGRASLATVASLAMGMGMTACGGGTIGFLYVMAGKTTTNGNGDSITGFKIDDYTGNLTQTVRSPYSVGGINPTVSVIKPGGRFMYTLNQGDSSGSGAGIAFFLVGGDGTLAYQQNYVPQGSSPQWLQLDGTGSFLFVLSKFAPPETNGGSIPTGCTVSDCGAVTVYSIAADTGRLTLVTNSTQRDSNQNFIPYFPVGPQPFTMKTASSYLVVINNDNTYSVLAPGTTSGQLIPVNTTPIQVPSTHQITSITTGGLYVYITDYDSSTQIGTIFPYTITTSGTLNAVSGGAVTSFVPNAVPVWTMTETKGRFLYVLNQTASTNTNAFSSISAYVVDSGTGKLTPVSGTGNPYPVGAGPVCMIEDPSSKYVYTSNSLGNSVTGYQINQSTGELNTLQRGTTFTVTGQPACLVVSGSIS